MYYGGVVLGGPAGASERVLARRHLPHQVWPVGRVVKVREAGEDIYIKITTVSGELIWNLPTFP